MQRNFPSRIAGPRGEGEGGAHIFLEEGAFLRRGCGPAGAVGSPHAHVHILRDRPEERAVGTIGTAVVFKTGGGRNNPTVSPRRGLMKFGLFRMVVLF